MRTRTAVGREQDLGRVNGKLRGSLRFARQGKEGSVPS